MSDYSRIEQEWSEIVDQVVNEYKAQPKVTAEERKEEVEELTERFPATIKQAYQSINVGAMSAEHYASLLAEIKEIGSRYEASDKDIKQVAQMLGII